LPNAARKQIFPYGERHWSRLNALLSNTPGVFL